MQRTFILWIALLAALLPGFALAHSGTGTQQINNEPIGPYRVYVWSDPEPPQVGEYHLAVALTENVPGDATSLAGGPVLDEDVTVKLTHQASGTTLTGKATHDQALNKLFYEASFAPARQGLWTVEVHIASPDGPLTVRFEDEILPKSLAWRAIGGGVAALLLLAAAVALYWSTQPRQKAEPTAQAEKRAKIL